MTDPYRTDPADRLLVRLIRTAVREELKAAQADPPGPLWSILLALVLLVPLGMLGGLVIWHLWAWFAVPLGAPGLLGLAHAYGLATLVTTIRGLRDPTKGTALETVVKATGFYLAAWGIGALVHALM